MMWGKNEKFYFKRQIIYPFLILLKQNSASKTPENFYCACANKHKKYPKTPQLKVITLKILANKIMHFFAAPLKHI